MAGHDVINWLDGNAKVGVEKICPGRHVRQNEWQPEWNNMYLPPYGGGQCYDYISDYECIFNHPIDNQYLQDNRELWQNLQAAKNQGWPLKIKDLAHFTKDGAAMQIVNDYGFLGRAKKINEDETHDAVFAKLSWWSPVFNYSQRNSLCGYLGEVIQLFIDEEYDDLDALKDQFATSDAFQPKAWRYGSHFFRYDLKALCENYSQFIDGEPQYKILGTFGYKQEVMHAVLVCSEADGAGQFSNYPDVPVNNEAVVVTHDDDGNWYWRPQATGGGDILRLACHPQNYPRYRRWEHVAFAFHIPDDEIMECDSPLNHHCNLAAICDDSEDEDCDDSEDEDCDDSEDEECDDNEDED